MGDASIQFTTANERKKKKEKKTLFKPSCIPPPRPAPAMPFIYVNIMGIAYPVRSHSSRVENACREPNVEIFPRLEK